MGWVVLGSCWTKHDKLANYVVNWTILPGTFTPSHGVVRVLPELILRDDEIEGIVLASVTYSVTVLQWWGRPHTGLRWWGAHQYDESGLAFVLHSQWSIMAGVVAAQHWLGLLIPDLLLTSPAQLSKWIREDQTKPLKAMRWWGGEAGGGGWWVVRLRMFGSKLWTTFDL